MPYIRCTLKFCNKLQVNNSVAWLARRRSNPAPAPALNTLCRGISASTKLWHVLAQESARMQQVGSAFFYARERAGPAHMCSHFAVAKTYNSFVLAVSGTWLLLTRQRERERADRERERAGASWHVLNKINGALSIYTREECRVYELQA